MDQSSPQRSEPPFYAVGLRKLALLRLATLGFYQLLWFFQHWRHLRDAGGQRVHPAARSLLAFIFVFPLAWRIGKAAEVWGTGTRIGGRVLLVSTVGLFLPDSEVTVEEQF